MAALSVGESRAGAFERLRIRRGYVPVPFDGTRLKGSRPPGVERPCRGVSRETVDAEGRGARELGETNTCEKNGEDRAVSFLARQAGNLLKGWHETGDACGQNVPSK